VLALVIDAPLMFGLGFVGVLAGFGYWPSAAIGAGLYSSLGTFVTGRSFGLIASEWILRTLQSIPATRRLLSSHTENA
jgi:hypothetical protein